jgi:MFS transporter, MHS family, shikimate and dehydroshikimate transport protein
VTDRNEGLVGRPANHDLGPADPQGLRRVVSASTVGTVIEWYDFFLYATAAALVFNVLFFPGSDPLTGTLAAFATYAVGFAVRPLGGLVFGYFGDKVGRKNILIITLLLMGISTTLMGLIPPYSAIGVWAAIILVVLRIFQGFGAGAEFAGAVLMTVENAPAGKRGFYGSWPQVGVAIGLIAATGIFSLVNTLPREQLLAWGWRIPFLLSIVVVGVGLYLRLRIMETPVFRELEQTHTIARNPLLDVVRNAPKQLLAVVGARFADNAVLYIGITFVLTYIAQQLKITGNVGLYGVLLAATVQVFAIPLFGALSDRVGRRPVYGGGAAFALLFAFPFFWLVDTKSTPLILLAIAILAGFAYSAMAGSQPAFFSELFEAHNRYSGVAGGRELGAILGGASPFIATALLSTFGVGWPVALFLAGMCLVTIVSILLSKETYRTSVFEHAEHGEVRQPTGG